MSRFTTSETPDKNKRMFFYNFHNFFFICNIHNLFWNYSLIKNTNIFDLIKTNPVLELENQISVGEIHLSFLYHNRKVTQNKTKILRGNARNGDDKGDEICRAG